MKTKNVAVIGIGRVGLPLALVLANKGFNVYGIGRDAEKMEKINSGEMPFMEKGANKILKKVKGKNFLATTDYSFVLKSDYIVITLGTPIDENMNPVFTQVEDAILSMSSYLRPKQTLILRSTITPGTTKYIQSLIKENSSLKVGENFYLAFCPERVVEGKAIEENEKIPQIIGGINKISGEKAAEFFKQIGVQIIISDDVSAELAKLFTNMYRYINFAIANEFMALADKFDRDIYEIKNLVNFGYSRGGLASPGLTGGPCLFKDGFFLISDLPYSDLISTSWKINESVPTLLIKKLSDKVKLENKKVALLGLGFKADIDDTRESLSFKVRKGFYRERSKVVLHDPYILEYELQKIEKDVYKTLKNADVIFVATNHKEYKSLDLKKIISTAKKNCIVCDIWNVFNTGKIIFYLKDLNK